MKGFLKAVAFAGLLVATGAQAGDLSNGGYQDGPVAADTWWQAGDVFVRVTGDAFVPNITTSSWNPAITGADLNATTTGLAALDLSYFLTKNIALELFCCVGQTDINAAGSLPGLGLGGKVGDTWFFPPTVFLQYHFDMTSFGTPELKPYLGIGGNYTWFFDEGNGTNGYHGLKLHSAGSVAFQAGADFHLAGNWFANVDVKYLTLGTDFSVYNGATYITGHADIDPIIVGGGIGYRFGGYVPLK